MSRPGAAQVDDGGAQVADGRVDVAQHAAPAVQAYERLLGDVLGVVGTEHGGESGHRDEMTVEELLIALDVVDIVRRAPGEARVPGHDVPPSVGDTPVAHVDQC